MHFTVSSRNSIKQRGPIVWGEVRAAYAGGARGVGKVISRGGDGSGLAVQMERGGSGPWPSFFDCTSIVTCRVGLMSRPSSFWMSVG